MMKKPLMMACTAALIAGCGMLPPAPEANQEEQAQQEETVEVVPAAPVELPQLLIARVPVAEDGTEDVEQMEMRSTFASVDADSDQDVTLAFEDSSSVPMNDELDDDTSIEQHGRWYWRTPWYPGKWLGRGLWWGRNPYVAYRGHRYGYQPYRYYGHGYRTRYNCGRYNYYVYRSCNRGSRCAQPRPHHRGGHDHGSTSGGGFNDNGSYNNGHDYDRYRNGNDSRRGNGGGFNDGHGYNQDDGFSGDRRDGRRNRRG